MQVSSVVVVLTKRQRSVCVLVAEGMANKEIAAALRISHSTVGGHLRRLFLKFGVRNRVLLAVRFSALAAGRPARTAAGGACTHL